MSLYECIQSAIDTVDEDGQPFMNAARGRQAQELFNELRDKYQKSMPADQAASLAASDTKRILRETTYERRRNRARDIQTQRQISDYVTNHRNRKGELDPAEALSQIIHNTGTGELADIYHTQKAVRRRLFLGLDDFVKRHNKSLLGNTREKAGLQNVQRELMGENTGDKVSGAMARAVADSFEMARKMFNAEGGNIPKLENWTPQLWNRRAFRKGSADEFVDDVFDEMDWDRIVDPTTGRTFGAGNGSREFLRKAFENIRTDGAANLDPKLNGGQGKSLANQRREQRVLHFKDADAWTRVAEKYGSADPFDATIGYIELMSRDIAQMKTLGRNPKASLEYAVQVARKQAVDMPDGALDRVDKKAKLARNVLANYAGDLSVAENEFFAEFMSGTRNVLSSAYLGGAVLSSISDAATVALASRHLGIPARRTLARVTQSLVDGASKEDMMRMVGVLETAMETSAAMTKFMGEVSGPELTRRMSSFVLRAQGLTHLTDINRASFQMEVMGLFSQQSDIAFDALPRNLRNSMKRSGIDADDWDVMRATPKFEAQSGGTFIVTRDVLDRADLPEATRDALYTKFQNMVERETDFAVPNRDITTETKILSGTKRGSIGGELLRGGLQFKGFGIHQFTNLVQRTQDQASVGGKVGNVVATVASLAMMGALAIQLKNLIKGKEPDDMMTDDFIARAILQGGGLGILGDFAVSETNRYGGGFAETILGPQVGFASQIAELTAVNGLQIYQGKDTKFGKEATTFVKQNLPGSNLWQIRLVMERMVFDQMQKVLDPDANKNFRNKSNRAIEDTGTGYWWAPGDFTPEF